VRDALRAYYTEKYGRVVGELELCIARVPEHEDRALEVVAREVEWDFFCEWDCGLDDWMEHWA